jgi:hypothetical protein
MKDTFEIKEPTVSPAGTQVSFVKENPELIKASLEERSADFELHVKASPVPARVQFGIIRDPRLRVIHAIPVDIRREGETYVASWEEAEEFGYGANRTEAVDDFGRTIAQLFVTLHREQDTLGPQLADSLSLLQRHLQFRG